MPPLPASDLDHVLIHTQPLWDEMRGQRLFITGGTGFFGCWLLESLAWANAKLDLNASAVVLTRDPAAFAVKAPHLAAHPAFRFHRGDVRHFEFPDGQFPCVIHAATEASAKLNAEDPLTMFDTVVEGTRRTLEFARLHGAKRFLLASSGAVYGRQPPELSHVPEDYSGGPKQTDPHWAYGEGKRAAEMLCTLYAKQHGLEPKIARCFAFVGPHLPLDAHFAIGNFIRNGLNGSTVQIHGDGTPLRSYLYAADLAIWLWTVLLAGQPCRPYNVGSETAFPLHDVARIVAEAFPAPPPIHIAGKANPATPVERYVPSTERARSELGLRERIPLRDAVKNTLMWHLRQDSRVATHSSA
jgi:nucleoside-diphosphate-sugar epimerase